MTAKRTRKPQPKQCEHVTAEFAAKHVAYACEAKTTKRTGIQHYTRRDPVTTMYVVTCHPFVTTDDDLTEDYPGQRIIGPDHDTRKREAIQQSEPDGSPLGTRYTLSPDDPCTPDVLQKNLRISLENIETYVDTAMDSDSTDDQIADAVNNIRIEANEAIETIVRLASRSIPFHAPLKLPTKP